ncbi:MAG: 4Fe-4S binding protein [Candidatus Thorarchaeota archaeon]|nr:4Fe-4S binding protein [Candidatus Thorarchaeota archaeon]
MAQPEKSIGEINERIRDGSVRVVNASEMTKIVAELGPEAALHEVDVVTTGTFGAMCSSGVWMNFGHSEPPIKMSRVWLNDVEAYAGVAAVDAYLGATRPSETHGIEYGGGHVIEDLIRRRPVTLRAQGYGTDCYPSRSISTEIVIDELNQATMSNPRNCYERYGVATNTSNKTLYTYMGKLLPDAGNANYSGAGELSPIANDPVYATIGVGTRVLLGGAEGFVVGSGTQHSPITGFGTLMLQGDLKQMSPEFIRGATITGYGSTLYVGVSVPIPVLNVDIARRAGVSDADITTSVFDYGVPSRSRPVLAQVNYEELKSGAIEVRGREVKTSSLSSLKMALRVAELLKRRIASGDFLLSAAVEPLRSKDTVAPMVQRTPRGTRVSAGSPPVPDDQLVRLDETRCVHCGLCVAICPCGVYSQDTSGTVSYRPDECTGCRECADVCPQRAILVRG